jgi:hypothetical protein
MPDQAGVRKTGQGEYVLYDRATGATLMYGYFATEEEAQRAASQVSYPPFSDPARPHLGLTPSRMAEERLRCYEYGATVQAELHFAEQTVESIEQRANAPPDSFLTPEGRQYDTDNAKILQMHKDVLTDHLERAVDALENGGYCGLPPNIVQTVGDQYSVIRRQVGEGNYTLARLNINKLRANLRHPTRMEY